MKVRLIRMDFRTFRLRSCCRRELLPNEPENQIQLILNQAGPGQCIVSLPGLRSLQYRAHNAFNVVVLPGTATGPCRSSAFTRFREEIAWSQCHFCYVFLVEGHDVTTRRFQTESNHD